ncbi:MCE family protein [Mycolicibacillus trivialis]|uniref:Mammalian cell entry protein n=1 Tax=Mycolicibacillus trivialis TaxID=1798 RepID=A0A1X2EPA6_9MYCO|nr:MCE family protein [Mycolicibacillus trivialis]ORX07041.1 mammalian cell entry protein [Mycolicibacillus trivialis]
MNKRYRKPVIGLSIFTVVSLAMTWMVYATLEREVAGPTHTYTATFTDILGMAPGDDVRVAGVRVGRVDKIDLEGTDARVTFRVQSDQTLYTDTIASVTYQNVIGQRYLGLSQDPNASGPRSPLPDRGHIPKEHTVPSFDISYMLNGFEPLFTQLDPEQVDNLTTALIQAFQGDETSVLVLTTQASVLAETLAGPDQVLGDLIGNLNDLMASLSAQNDNLENMIGQTRSVMSELAARRDQLVASVGSTNSTVGRLATIVDTITPDVQEFITRQPGFLDYGLRDGRERFAYLGANLPLLLKGIARITQEGAYINGYPCNVDFAFWQGLFYWFRAFVAAATPGGDTVQGLHTPVCR